MDINTAVSIAKTRWAVQWTYNAVMNDDDKVCLCFHVSKRKIVNYCKREHPPVASLISDCLSAGTGCGWCVPFLKSLHKQSLEGVEAPDLPLSPEQYAKRRATFRVTGQRSGDGDADADEQGSDQA